MPWQIIALLGACLIVYAFLIPAKKNSGNDRKQIASDIERSLEQFSMELEMENQDLIQRIAEMKADHGTETAKLQSRMESLEKLCGELNEARIRAGFSETPPPASGSEEAAVSPADPKKQIYTRPLRKSHADQGPEPQKPEPQSPDEAPEERAHLGIKHRYRDVFQLHQQEKSIEYIAKKLGMNKGEVQLIIQLANQEEQFRA